MCNYNNNKKKKKLYRKVTTTSRTVSTAGANPNRQRQEQPTQDQLSPGAEAPAAEIYIEDEAEVMHRVAVFTSEDIPE